LAAERAAGLDRIETYRGFGERVARTKRSLLSFLVDAKERGLCVVGYGAPAKGNTLLNYCGVKTDLLEYTVDMSPTKQGRRLPGDARRGGEDRPLHARRGLRRRPRSSSRLADALQMVRGGADGRQPFGDVRARRHGARFPDARRRHGSAVSDVGVPPSRERAR